MKEYLNNQRGDVSLIVLFVILIPLLMLLYAYTTDSEISLQGYFRVKSGLNRAVHAAALQVNNDELSSGKRVIDPSLAQSEFLSYLQENLSLDDTLNPLPNTFLKDQVVIIDFKVENTGPFPYHFVDTTNEVDIWLSRPGVIAIIEVKYPRIFSVLGPIAWKVNASHELIYQ